MGLQRSRPRRRSRLDMSGLYPQLKFELRHHAPFWSTTSLGQFGILPTARLSPRVGDSTRRRAAGPQSQTAKALCLTIPLSLLGSAGEAIE